MLRRVSGKVAPTRMGLMAQKRFQNYKMIPFSNTVRRPQLTDAEREKVQINYEDWPQDFKDYDPYDPYKNFPEWIEGFTTWTYYWWGIEVGFIMIFWENVWYVPY